MSQLMARQQQLISHELLGELQKSFRYPIIKADTSPEDIKWAAAQAAVVSWIIKRVSGQQSLPTHDELRPEHDAEPSNMHPDKRAVIKMGVD